VFRYLAQGFGDSGVSNEGWGVVRWATRSGCRVTRLGFRSPSSSWGPAVDDVQDQLNRWPWTSRGRPWVGPMLLMNANAVHVDCYLPRETHDGMTLWARPAVGNGKRHGSPLSRSA
jgi:hypothetical protein